MKTKKLLTAAVATAITAASADAALIIQTSTNSSSQDWNTPGSWSDNAAPISANDYQTADGLILRGGPSQGGASTFGGGSLEVVSGSRLLMKNRGNTTSTINGNLTISGGLVDLGPNSGGVGSGTLAVNNLIVSGTGSRLEVDVQGREFTIDGTLTGSGDLTFTSNSNSASGGTISIAGISNFFGAINLSSNANGLNLVFGTSYTFSNSFTMDEGSVLNLNSGQTLTFDAGDLVDPFNGAVAVGTYSGATLDALGANYANNGGTLVVIPEPSAAALAGLLLGLGLLRRRR
jgi:hypothetical protein